MTSFTLCVICFVSFTVCKDVMCGDLPAGLRCTWRSRTDKCLLHKTDGCRHSDHKWSLRCIFNTKTNHLLSARKFALLTWSVAGEVCTSHGDCGSTLCHNDHHVFCEYPPTADDAPPAPTGLCTCAINNVSCQTRDDCLSPANDVPCLNQERIHCYDNKCVCSRHF